MSIVTLLVTGGNITQSERRFDRSTTVQTLKEKLEPITGASCNYMSLQLFDKNDQLLGALSDEKMLGYYGVEDYYRIHVTDTNPHAKTGAFTDVSQVEKFEMSETDYDKRQDTVRDYLRRNKLGKFSDEAQIAASAEAGETAREGAAEAALIHLGDRCEVETDGTDLKRRGTVRFIGLTHFKPGFWVGVQYDEPLGKNDGSVGGERYFSCPPRFGAFVRPNKVTVGDFPEEDLFGDLEEM